MGNKSILSYKLHSQIILCNLEDWTVKFSKMCNSGKSVINNLSLLMFIVTTLWCTFKVLDKCLKYKKPKTIYVHLFYFVLFLLQATHLLLPSKRNWAQSQIFSLILCTNLLSSLHHFMHPSCSCICPSFTSPIHPFISPSTQLRTENSISVCLEVTCGRRWDPKMQ